MTYTSGIKEPLVYINDHNVFDSFTENEEAFFKWMFLDQL
jgi:hypothetical protein